MSKMDNLRAMREAKYAETVKRSAAAAKSTGSKATAGKAKDPAAPTPRADPAAAARPSDDTDAAEPALCGHRNMSGRSCTREHGHAAKSHRYS